MQPRILSLHFPRFAIDRLELEDPGRRDRPFAIAEEVRGHLQIGSVNALASQAGVRAGMRLSDARTLTALEIVPPDHLSDGATLLRWVRWCDRYTPIAAEDGRNGILLNITGCAHLFGGEEMLLADLENRIRQQGYRARGAIASTKGAAWALARYSKERIIGPADTKKAFYPLPIASLRLPDEAVKQLRRVGVFTVASLCDLSRNSLTTRFGPEVVLRIDQAFDGVEEPFMPYREPAPHWAGKSFEFPLTDLAMLLYALEKLLRHICIRLEREQAGARELRVDCHRVDGEVLQYEIGTVKPVRDVKHLLRLFSEKLSFLDFGCGVERLVLTARAFEERDFEQLNLEGQASKFEKESEFDALLDRFGMRLGFETIARLRIQESFLPERAVKFHPISQPDTVNAEWPEYRIRPIELNDPPRRIQVATFGDMPTALRVENRWRTILRQEGPERLTDDWWRRHSSTLTHRDYFRIEDSQAERFWIFRNSDSNWYLHGRFA